MPVSIRTLFIVAVFLLFNVYQSFAGLVMERERYEEGGQKVRGTIYMQDNKVKSFDEEGQFSAIFDLNTGEMIQVDNLSKTYSSTKAEDYFAYYKQYSLKMKTAMMQQLSELPPNQRAQAEGMMKRQGIELPGNNVRAVDVILKKTGDTNKIAGYEAVKYEIYRDGKLDEEIWTSSYVGFQEEIDTKEMIEYLSELRKIEDSMRGSSLLSQASEQTYTEVFSTGFPMKTIDYPLSGNSIVEETIKVSKKKIDSSEFQAPKGYKKVPLQQMLQLSSQ
ncbi:MAG: DUF4412 domain-containing protein [Thermodesulfobacteriales bacterium]|nr:MAG: DUF4412 domain-containing protein [Thermodesulfobacteriales bacterium]